MRSSRRETEPGPAPDRPAVEVSAGAVLLRGSPPDLKVLVVKVRSDGYELPKGHLEWHETPERAATRELQEETGLISEPKAGELLGVLDYSFSKDGLTVHKRVFYFLFTIGEPGTLLFGEKPSRTKEVRWINEADVPVLPLVSEDLRSLLLKAFAAGSSRRSCEGQANSGSARRAGLAGAARP
jgi:ADP-ribose pyrophosphatase YjhB (NUDIX family)